MTDGIINIYKKNGTLLGSFREPQISQFGNDEYEIRGIFCDPEGKLVERLEFNPQSLPYWAEIQNATNIKHSRLTNVYIQRGRQPVTVTGLGS